MAKTKITSLTELTDTNIAVGDLIPIVDVSDTSQASTGTTKKTTITSLATAVAAAFSGDNATFVNLNTTGTTTLGDSADATTVNGTLAVTGATTLSSTLGVTGAATFSEDLYIIKNEFGAYRKLVIENSNAGGYARTIYQVGSGGASGISGVNYAPSIFFKIGIQVNDTSTPITFVTNNDTERMRITSGGDVGIGTSSPGAKLDVNGGTNSEMRVTTSGSGFLQVGQFANGAFIGTSSADPTAGILRFGTGGTTKATIDSSGNVGIGVAGPLIYQSEKMIVTLKQTMIEKEALVAQLTGQVDSLQTSVTGLTTEVQQSQETIRARDQSLEEKRRELATIYYVIGSKKELRTQGFITAKGGVLGMGKTVEATGRYTESSFTSLDTDQESIIPTSVAKVEVVTAQPLASYELKVVGGLMEIHILDAKEFRKVKHLIVMTK